ncbi:uncharacterized protein E0L32_004258 [Thyridium curvatum]|uniref:Uncharacterized protein n=1 Tax=Thyridium curvatum TaxID=1093900 RepID=A0A507BG83_9PEZI|nr:uncharacterized protein E0L32_004258 [Thyridium curvatum]TPX15560.1 hypothetical protein E0L32_004258 [Thyridium curvatum]
MRFSHIAPLLAWALSCAASPAPLVMPISPGPSSMTELEMREALELATRTQHLEKRLSADFSMDKTWDNEVLFQGSYVGHSGDGPDKEHVSLAVTCRECYTRGTVTARLTDERIIDPAVRLDFRGVEAYVDLEVAASAGATYAINLFTSNSPVGLGFPGLSVGVVFYVDLVFSLDAAVDLTGGFYVRLADDAFLEASIFEGAVVDSFFQGLTSKSIPIAVRAGRATFKADLRLRVQCGAEADGLVSLVGLGASAVMGVYANLIEFVAVLDSTPECPLRAREWWDLNVGAYARLDVVVDYSTLGPVPTVSTTLLTAPTLTQCLGGAGGAAGAATPTLALPAASSSPAEIGGVVGGSAASKASTAVDGLVVVVTRPAQSIVATTGTASKNAIIPTITAAPSLLLSSTGSTAKFPLGNSSVPTANGSSVDLVTSTLYTTATYTLTACAANVVNCPADLASQVVVTRTVDVLTTVCPVGATITAPPAAAASPVQSVAEVHKAVITDVVTLVPCKTPVVETFVAPSPSPTATASATASKQKQEQAAATTAPAVPVVVGGAKQAQGPWAGATGSTLRPAAHGTARPSVSFAPTGAVVGGPTGAPVVAGGAVLSRDRMYMWMVALAAVVVGGVVA